MVSPLSALVIIKFLLHFNLWRASNSAEDKFWVVCEGLQLRRADRVALKYLSTRGDDLWGGRGGKGV